MAWHAGCRYDGAGYADECSACTCRYSGDFERDQHDRNGLYVCKPERCFGQNRKAYAIDTTATNKMGAEVTKILGNNNNGGTEKAGWISELTDGVFGSFNGAGIAGFNGGNDGRGLGWFCA